MRQNKQKKLNYVFKLENPNKIFFDTHICLKIYDVGDYSLKLKLREVDLFKISQSTACIASVI
jgi:hypothetical protein